MYTYSNWNLNHWKKLSVAIISCRCTTTDSDFKCSSFWSKRAASKEFCGILLNKSGPFANCIKADENLAKELYESCVDDVCSYEDEPAFAMKSACMAGESLAEMCLTKGLGKVLWRKSDFCRKNIIYCISWKYVFITIKVALARHIK